MDLIVAGVIGLAFGMSPSVIWLIWTQIIEPRLPGSSRAQHNLAPRRWHRYAVVHDMRPFGYRVESYHATKFRARLNALRSMYLKAETVAFIKSETDRLENRHEFDRTLAAAVDLDRSSGSGWRLHSQSL